ncbi:hypothetical protein VTJ04DRAFT_314 [Mycothermus thermophilus]|uniref:uncharacterized protein n=1 Tax=Humicola insolens TaxID=85995 RepID=UPI0037447B29
MRPARTLFPSSLPAAAAPARTGLSPAAVLFNTYRTSRRPRLQQQRHCHHQQQKRAFSLSAPRSSNPTEFTATTPPAAPAPTGLTRLTSRQLISISGPDAAHYLQGVITTNLFPGSPPSKKKPELEHLRRDAGFYTAFLTAQGRVLYDVFIYRDPSAPIEDAEKSSWLIEVDKNEAANLLQHIRRYKLRARFDVKLVEEDQAQVWAAWDDTSSSKGLLSSALSSSSVAVQMPDPRAPGLGQRILVFSSSPGGADPDHQIPIVSEEAYHLRRYLYGVPEGPAELPPSQALPHESNIDLVTSPVPAIDFRKGCYVGQELTVRTEHRGVVRKRILPCLLYPEDSQPPPSSSSSSSEQQQQTDDVPSLLAKLYQPSISSPSSLTAADLPHEASIGRANKSGRSAGKWLRGIGNVGLALCRLESMTDVALPGEKTGGTGVVYSPEDEFVVPLGGEAEGKKVKVKAFVPGWFRRGLEGKGREGM